jgi:hypothetical protein
LILLQPPYTHRRYDFYKSRVPNFSSSDPRKVVDPEEPIEETQCLLINTKPYGSKSFAYDDDDDQDEEVQAGKKVDDTTNYACEMPRTHNFLLVVWSP